MSNLSKIDRKWTGKLDKHRSKIFDDSYISFNEEGYIGMGRVYYLVAGYYMIKVDDGGTRMLQTFHPDELEIIQR